MDHEGREVLIIDFSRAELEMVRAVCLAILTQDVIIVCSCSKLLHEPVNQFGNLRLRRLRYQEQ